MMTRPQLNFRNRLVTISTVLAGLLSATLMPAPARADSDLTESIAKQVEALVAGQGQEPLADNAATDLYREAVKQHGNAGPLLAWLAKARGEGRDIRSRTLAELEVHIASQCGDLERANEVLTSLLEIDDVAASRFDLRIWQARLFDALGKIDKAKETYESLLAANLSQADQQMVRLRLALMGLMGKGGSDAAKSARELIDLANKSNDKAFRNRAAIILAVQDQYAEAIKLFVVEGDEKARFRGASRAAEWAIRANNRGKAIASAWDAVRSAQMKRDRRYALTLLVEAYRMEKARDGLAELVDAFAAAESKHDAPLSDEIRATWVSLLRELGRYDDAIKLFKASAGEGGFSVELRRELLDMEGEAGNVKQMIASYREVIADEPDQLAWRGGLTRVLLEQGDRDGAVELWGDYLGGQTSGTQLLQAAQILGDLGLQEMAARVVERMVALKVNLGQALLYLADLHRRQGRMAEAEATLDRLNVLTNVGDAVRAELADAYERVGRQDKAVEVMEQICASRKTVAEDIEMRLAWLYSEIGDEDKALQQWMAMWRKVTSPARRRYVEDRMMTVASRVGALADIAIDLEEKLRDGKADDRDAGLLVRIYSRVGDSVAATEILESYMAQTGSSEVARLKEKGRIYQICNDYWNYEKVVERLIEIDPEGRTDYLRHLALSMLERGKPQDARTVLLKLRSSEGGADLMGGEFEAGILSMVGLRAEAADAYRRAIAKHPDRIECYLLLANLLKATDNSKSAVGMFQFLAETAERDDLFTIAIDGLLNMEAEAHVMQWARRITLERLAGREDKNYLYQLLADLAFEVNDREGQVRALENSLAVSGNRRLSVLRECMDLSSRLRGGAFYRAGKLSASNTGNKSFFAFGRRLIGLGELMPPQVFIDLGRAFLDDGDLVNAKQTFDLAKNVGDERGYVRQVGRIFELTGHLGEALSRYDRLLRTDPSDIGLIARVAKLNEQQGRDVIASRFYERGHNLLTAQLPLTTQEVAAKSKPGFVYHRGNIDVHRTYSDQFLRGLLVTIADDAVDSMLARQRAVLDKGLQELKVQIEGGRKVVQLIEAPRIRRQSEALRRLYYAFGRLDDVEAVDLALLRQFNADADLPVLLVRERVAHGQYGSARRLMELPEIGDEQRRKMKTILGEADADRDVAGVLAPSEMWHAMIPALIAKDVDAARKLLRRVDVTRARNSDDMSLRSRFVNGVYTRSPVDLEVWMRLAVVLGDDVQALKFARRRAVNHRDRGRLLSQLVDCIKSCERILPEESFRSLIPYAANLFREDQRRVVEYLWLISNFGDVLQKDRPSDQTLLSLVEKGKLALGYRLSIQQALEMLPRSIRAKALSEMIDNTSARMRLYYLVRVPFETTKPLGEDVGQVIATGVADLLRSDLKPENTWNHLDAMHSRGTEYLNCADNAEVAMKVIDVFIEKAEATGSKEPLAKARMIKTMLLWEAGRKDEATKMARQLSKVSAESNNSRIRSLQMAMSRIASGNPVKLAPQPKQEEKSNDGGMNKAIADAQRSLANARKITGDKGKATVADIERRLGELWISRGHAVNGLPFWVSADDYDRAAFADQKARRDASHAKAGPASQPASAASLNAIARPVYQTSTYHYISAPAREAIGVRAALESGDKELFRKKLRSVWRSLPPVDRNPYGNVYRRSDLSRLTWPKHGTLEGATRPDDQDGQITPAEKRRELRGGLAMFESVQKSSKADDKPLTLWQALVGEPVAVQEMERLLRSRDLQELDSLNEVILGLLRVERNSKGDDAVFAELINDVRRGRAGRVVLVKFFAMAQEDPRRIKADNRGVLEDLIHQLGEDQLDMLSQLAFLCGSAGQNDRSSALYTYCVMRGYNFVSLISSAKKVFEGDELMALAERMYAVTPGDDALHDGLMLELRLEHLPADEAIARSTQLFVGLDDAAESSRPIIASGVQLFARAGQLKKAQECLRMFLHKQTPAKTRFYRSYRAPKPEVTVPRSDILKMFPKDGSGYGNYKAWLAGASGQISQLLSSADIERMAAIDALVVIATRQWQNDDVEGAGVTLTSIQDILAGIGGPRAALAIDVMRQAGLFEQALKLQTALHESDQLSHVRLGDMLRDTARVHGGDRALELMEKLLKESLDDDLLDAARDLPPNDSRHIERISDLRRRNHAALDEYDRRLKDRRLRQEMRAKWQKEDKQK